MSFHVHGRGNITSFRSVKCGRISESVETETKGWQKAAGSNLWAIDGSCWVDEKQDARRLPAAPLNILCRAAIGKARRKMEEKVAGWSMVCSFVNSQIGNKRPYGIRREALEADCARCLRLRSRFSDSALRSPTTT